MRHNIAFYLHASFFKLFANLWKGLFFLVQTNLYRSAIPFNPRNFHG